ncbi:MAG: stage IV sporulation protein A [Ruminococcus sp.]|nr:stage IV sporulation protein A [Ruminococcus sp.]
MTKDIYADIAKRTGGDIYIGIVGPVRTGKSTLIKQFMEKLVIPNISDESKRIRATDELPQSAGGRTIMTTEPKFIPEEAAEISLGEHTQLKIRMVDCVGYIIPSSLGYIENNQPRMVKTPWFDEEIPFGMAAEVGTQKVITEHSTVGLVVTTDGSITDMPREEYEVCEERVINELQQLEKPFVVLVNCVNPHTKQVNTLCENMRNKYHCAVMPVCCPELEESDIQNILTELLYAFPLREVSIQTARWINELDKDHWLRSSVFSAIRDIATELQYVRDVPMLAGTLVNCEHITDASVKRIELGTGSAIISVSINPSLFYKILGETTGLDLTCESDLFPVLTELSKIQKAYNRIAPALAEVEATGYGIVMPEMEELSLEEPEIIKQGGKYGVRLKASAPSIHLMKASIRTAVSPIVGTEKQSEELVMYLLEGFQEEPTKIWSSNIFGKSLHELVNEGLHSKLSKMPIEARLKLQETLERVINEGCSGLICFIL